ncbi:hypothetical protein ACNPKZ_20125 [Shewanella algae]|uniref:hypothetical protein n=1 Tax=Shewanella algae TaxID=38313 RepID=UPI0015940F49|nr:hypothetical protein KVP08_022650 [Shewanella putrefaciens]
MNITEYVSERLKGASLEELQAIVDRAEPHVDDDDPMGEAIAAELFEQAQEMLATIQAN